MSEELKCELCGQELCNGTPEGISNSIPAEGKNGLKWIVVCKKCALNYYDNQK